LVERALGVKYNVKTDRLVFEVAKLSSKVGEKGEKMTERKTHSFVHSFYDPIGMLSPITLILKKLTQKYAKYAWDHPIPEEEVQLFSDWVKKMPEIDKLSVRHWYKIAELGEIESIQLHVFCDTSEIAYGECAYLRYCDKAGKIASALVLGKTRVTPL
jgi:hypothetical protein